MKCDEWFPVNANQETRMARIRNLASGDHNFGTRSRLIARGYRITGPLDRERLGVAVERVTARHSAFRAVFDWTSSPARQGLGAQLPQLEVLTDVQNDNDLRSAVWAPIDLSTGPMARFILAQRPSGTELWITAEHMIADGWSMSILLRELAQAYSDPSRPLPSVAIQNHEVGLLQQQHCESSRGQADRSYWRAQFGDDPWLPFWYPGLNQLNTGDRSTGSWKRVVLSNDEAPVGPACRRAEATVYMLVLAGLCRAISQRTGWDAVPVHSPFANRWSDDLQNTITHVANLLPLSIAVDPASAPSVTVRQVKRQVIQALSHASYPIHSLRRELTPELWGAAQRPPFLNLNVEADIPPPFFADLELSPLPIPPLGPAIGLVVWCLASKAGLTISLGCRSGFLPAAELHSLATATAAEVRTILTDLA